MTPFPLLGARAPSLAPLLPGAFLLEQLHWLWPGGRVLLLGPREGHEALALARAGFQVTAFDANPVVLAGTRALLERHGHQLHTIEAELRDFEPVPGTFEGLVALRCDLPAGVRATMHHRLDRVLRRRGVAIIEVDHPRALAPGAPASAHERTHTLEELEANLGSLRTLVGREGPSALDGRFVTQFVGAKR